MDKERMEEYLSLSMEKFLMLLAEADFMDQVFVVHLSLSIHVGLPTFDFSIPGHGRTVEGVPRKIFEISVVKSCILINFASNILNLSATCCH